jgi:DNA-binding LytR/AlgR family response regulator
MELYQALLKVNTKHGIKTLKTCNIKYITANNVRSKVFQLDGGSFETHHTLKWFERKLATDAYCRCHRSFIVNFSNVLSYASGYFVMLDKSTVKISRQRKNSVLAHYNKFIEMKT